MFTIKKSIERNNKPLFLQNSTGQNDEKESKTHYGDTLYPVFSQRIGISDCASCLELFHVEESILKLTDETTAYQVYKYNEGNHCIEEHKLCHLPYQLSVSLQQNDNLGVFVFSSSALFFKRYGRDGTDLRIGYLPNLDHNENDILYCNLTLAKTISNPGYTMYAVSRDRDLAVVVRPQRELVLSIDIVSISKLVELNGDSSVKGTLLQHFEIEIPSYLECYTNYELVCDDQMLLAVTWSRDHKQYSFIGISIQSCELKYHKSLTITERCLDFENGYFILNGNNGTNGLLLFNVGDEERKLQMYSLHNNFELINECKVDDISQFNENDYLTFQVSNDVLFISSDGTRSIHVIECSYTGLYEKYRLKVLFGCESDSFCDFSVVFNGFEAVVFNQRYVKR